MNVLTSNAVAAQVYAGIKEKKKNDSPVGRNSASPASAVSDFRLPQNATPKGDWVLSENANPQNFDSGAPRGTYLNLVV